MEQSEVEIKSEMKEETDIRGWINLLRRIDEGDSTTNTYHLVAHTSKLLNSFGIKGDIWIGRAAVNKRHSRDTAHRLTEEEWIDVFESINNPLCISEYLKVKNGFRVYTQVEHNGENVCVGLEVRPIGRGIEISKVSTVFARHRIPSEDTETERILYRNERTPEESSTAPNSRLYPQASVAKVGNNFE